MPRYIPVTRQEYHELEVAMNRTSCNCNDTYRRRRSPLVHTINFVDIKIFINDALAKQFEDSVIITPSGIITPN